ncbi:hypothetical protein BD779DRAFT_1548394 [Infundibulicybe gibba]|nr:hypothetical protein BD779DRAFT_1548394 [Infundibulicybe gibba]
MHVLLCTSEGKKGQGASNSVFCSLSSSSMPWTTHRRASVTRFTIWFVTCVHCQPIDQSWSPTGLENSKTGVSEYEAEVYSRLRPEAYVSLLPWSVKLIPPAIRSQITPHSTPILRTDLILTPSASISTSSAPAATDVTYSSSSSAISISDSCPPPTTVNDPFVGLVIVAGVLGVLLLATVAACIRLYVQLSEVVLPHGSCACIILNDLPSLHLVFLEIIIPQSLKSRNYWKVKTSPFHHRFRRAQSSSDHFCEVCIVFCGHCSFRL